MGCYKRAATTASSLEAEQDREEKRAYVMPLGYHLLCRALKSRWLRMSVLLRKWNVKLQVGRRKPIVGLSLKETKECNSSTVAKLQVKLTMLEQIHEECPCHGKVREGEWSSKMEKIVADLNSCTLELESKETHFKDITTEPVTVHAPTPATAYGSRP
nr:hypothetical protein [Tanacetum cinerariifolium]